MIMHDFVTSKERLSFENNDNELCIHCNKNLADSEDDQFICVECLNN